jgi:CRISPR type III-A-associated protein Csm2
MDPRLNQIINEGNADVLVSYARELGSSVAVDDLGRTQIRNIFGMIKQIQSTGLGGDNTRRLKLLIPKLDYAAAREKKLKKLVESLTNGIQLVGNDPTKFNRFADFFEATVAYHYVVSEDKKDQRRQKGGRR